MIMSFFLKGLRFITPKAFSELLEAIERVPNADGDAFSRVKNARETTFRSVKMGKLHVDN